MKKKKVVGILCLLIAISLVATVMSLKKSEAEEHIPIAIKTETNEAIMHYGINQRYIKETSPPYNHISITLGDHELDAKSLVSTIKDEVEYVQIIIEMNHQLDKEKVTEDFKELVDALVPYNQVYVYLDYQEDYSKKEALEHYKLLEEKVQHENIHIVYDYRAYNNSETMKYIGIDIHDLEDINTLDALQQELTSAEVIGPEIIVNDYIVQSQEANLTTTLNLINELYYKSAINYPNVKWINQQSSLGKSDLRITQAYEALLENEWLAINDELVSKRPYTFVNGEELIQSSEELEVLVPYTNNVEYVEYKLNEVSIGQVFRYPYGVKVNFNNLENRYNELRIIINQKDVEKPLIKTIYFEAPIQQKVEERAERATSNYDISQNMIYEKPYIPVLMYHEFMEVVGESEDEQSITVGTELFEQQLVAMLDNGYTPITFWDLAQYFEGKGGLPEKPVIITTDDGYLSNYLIAYPILKKYNVPATYFITSKYIGVMTTRPHFTWEQAKEMEESGLIDIQSHTHGHAPMDALSEAGVLYQTLHSFELIEKHLGKRDVKVLSYPQFRHTADTINWVEESGIDLQVTNLNKKKSETLPLDIKRIHVSNETTPEDLIEEMERLTTN